MNRRKFLEKIGAVTAVAVVAPNILLEPTVKIDPVTKEAYTGLVPAMEQVNSFAYKGITKEHIREAVEHVFRNSEYPKPERRIKFIVHGEESMKRVHKIFTEEFKKQINEIT